MSKKKELLPKLRFPEFLDEWEYVNGDKLFDPISNKDHNSDMPILAVTQEQGAIPRDMIDYHVSVTEKSIESYKIVEIGDFIISLRSFQGGIEYSDYLGLCSPAYIILRKKTDLINDFYRHYFKSFSFIRDLNKNLEGIRDGKMISYKQFSEIFIPKPSKEEQQKIASCLSSLDEVIAAESQKLDLLKDHKKGLMQNLFPLEGEKVPKYRFKEFEKDGEWVEMTINQVFGSFSGGTPNTSKKEYYGGSIPFIRSAEIDKEETELSLTKEGLKNSSAKLVNKGDLLVALYGANSGETAISKIDGAINQAILCLQSEYSNAFTYNFLTLRKNWIVSKFIQGGQGNLSGNIIKSISIPFPSPKEQQKIASCLSSLDALITEQIEKIEQLKLHKKGLMQGLFPKIND